MAIRGMVSNGVVVLDDDKALPDGTVVRVEPVRCDNPSDEQPSAQPGSVWEKLLRLAGTVKGTPPDFARNHDHYIHGAPKE